MLNYLKIMKVNNWIKIVQNKKNGKEFEKAKTLALEL